jgi:hypothetical protein
MSVHIQVGFGSAPTLFSKNRPASADGPYVSIPHDDVAAFHQSLSYLENVFRERKDDKYRNARLLFLDAPAPVEDKEGVPVSFQMTHNGMVIDGTDMLGKRFTINRDGSGTLDGQAYAKVQLKWDSDTGIEVVDAKNL